MRGTSHVEKCERHVLLRMRVSREVKSWGYVDLEHECIISWVEIREWRRQSDAEHGQLIGTCGVISLSGLFRDCNIS